MKQTGPVASTTPGLIEFLPGEASRASSNSSYSYFTHRQSQTSLSDPADSIAEAGRFIAPAGFFIAPWAPPVKIQLSVVVTICKGGQHVASWRRALVRPSLRQRFWPRTDLDHSDESRSN